ncbi:hypothetical protein KY348_02410 [Candidatus Woesearchaeota archaeon]|nr:hypothetical protein [Candidatus Woesearchaeota archaeon]
MNKESLKFTSLFFLGLIILIYFLGSSITGYVVQTMYCDEDKCQEFCKYDKECKNPGELCCDKGGFGVCENPLTCDKGYVYSPEAKMNFDFYAELKEPAEQSPAYIEKTKIRIFLVLLAAALAIGIIYAYRRKK